MDFHDPISAGTHFVAAAWALFATLLLLRLTRQHSPGQRASIAVYGLSMVVLYNASGLYHSVAFGSDAELQVFRRLDFSAIFLLVVGSELPVFVYLLSGRLRWSCVIGVTLLGTGGTAAVWLSATISVPVMVGVYAGLALLGLLPIRIYARKLGRPGLSWLLGSVLIYALGGVCEILKWPVLVAGVFGPHEILHITDILGTLTHLVLVVRFVLPLGMASAKGV